MHQQEQEDLNQELSAESGMQPVFTITMHKDRIKAILAAIEDSEQLTKQQLKDGQDVETTDDLKQHLKHIDQAALDLYLLIRHGKNSAH
jgi:hypothetical protein